MAMCFIPSNTRGGSNSDKRDITKHYKIGIKLGAGAFGQVREAKHFGTKQIRAVKIIFKHEKGVTLDKIMREIELMRMMNHRYVVRLHDFFQDQKFLYAVMDKFYGKELVDKLTWKGLREKHSSAYVKMMLLAVEYISTKVKVVHRDIKPENFIFKSPDPFGDLIMIDFGLSDTIRDGEYLNTCCGTVNFLAPEVIVGKYRFEVDVWGVGVVAYLLLFGRFPFSGSGDSAIVKEIVNKELIFKLSQSKKDNVHTVSDESKDLVRKMLKKNPKERITVRDALDHHWINPNGKKRRASTSHDSSMPSTDRRFKSSNRRKHSSSPKSGKSQMRRRPDKSTARRPDKSNGRRPDTSHGANSSNDRRPDKSQGRKVNSSNDRQPDKSNGRKVNSSNDQRPDKSHGRAPSSSNDRRPDRSHARRDSSGGRPDSGRRNKTRRRPDVGKKASRPTTSKARKSKSPRSGGRSGSPRSPRRHGSPASKKAKGKSGKGSGKNAMETKLLFNT